MVEKPRAFHPLADLFPLLEGEEYQALMADIAANGLREAIWLHPDGRIIDGRNRYRACLGAGVDPVYRTWNEQGSLLAFVVSMNIHRRHLNESQRAMVAAKIANLQHGGDRKSDQAANLPLDSVSQPEAAKLLNVSERSLRSAAHVQREAVPEVVQAVERGHLSVSAAAGLVGEEKEVQREIVRQIEEDGEMPANAIRAAKPHVAQNTGYNEWYTPEEYIKAVRKVMGGIDLDPASSKEANTVVKAKHIYTVEQDGLQHEWKGRVYMNPPYTAGLVSKFIDKMVESVNSNAVTQAVVLVNNATETNWFYQLVQVASAACFIRGRVKFWQPSGQTGPPLQGQVILYIGPHVKEFREEFADLGWTVRL